MDRVIAGLTEAVEAEYGYTSDMPYIIVHLYNGEPVTVEGFVSELRCRQMLKSDYSEVSREWFE